MAHTLTTHRGFGNFDAAAIAHDAFITNLFIFTAMALPVFARSEDLFAEKAFFLGLQSTVVDRLRF